MNQTIFKTEWGWMGLGATERGVKAIVLPKRSRGLVATALSELNGNGSAVPPRARGVRLEEARAAIEAYLAGESRTLDLPLDLEGQPKFRVKVWEALRGIPYGRVRSYGWVAKKIGKPKAARAVGGACGANPVPLVVPCHRVVAGDGSLGGFSGGLPNKRRLLKLEGISV